MTEQTKKKRLFFALWPSEKQRQKVESAIEPYRGKLAGTYTARDNWHLTLVFIGGFPEDHVPGLQEAARQIDCPALELQFDGIHFWKRPKIMCLYANYVPSQLLGLIRSLESAAQAFGFKPEERPYRAHITIARKARFFAPITLAQPLEFQWSGFHLVESVSTPTGVQYKPLDQ